uniref:Ciliary neurotrophic factor n=1 Tax=Electrophorus electricus TaxID=8005 RepID=A0A4W4EXR4_ELEEL
MALSRIVLCIYTLAVVCEGCCAPVAQASLSFPNSLRLTRTLRARVQQLLQSYKEQQFGDRNFEDRRLILNTLPSVTINYRSWLQIQDMQRLYIASHNLRTFWEHLEAQRQKLELEGEEGREHQSQRRNKRARPQLSLAQSILIVQLDLRDLLKQVSFQSPNPSPTSSPTSHSRSASPASSSSSGSSRWVSRLEGYVILRDLELYLGRLARDYTLLSAKH